MTENEMLSAISDIIDKKMKPMDKSIKQLGHEVGQLGNKVDRIECKVGQIEEKVDRVEYRVGQLEEKVDRVEHRVGQLEEKVDQLESSITVLKLTNENEILPRIQNIEACYVSTYKRYAEESEQLEKNTNKIEIISKVVEKHSKKLQMIS